MKIKNSIDNNYIKPLTLIIGGYDIDSGITTILKKMAKADNILIGGTVANSFLLAQGFDIGKSDHDPAKIPQIRELMVTADSFNKKIILPVDVIVSDKVDEKSDLLDLPVEDVEGDMKILDVGSKTIALFKQILDQSGTVYWSGPLGHYDIGRFKKATCAIADCLKNNKSITVIPNGEEVTELLS